MRESLSEYCQREQQEELLEEWDDARNLPLTPETVSHGSKKHVWWTCAKGHHWQAAVHTRTGSGTGCPYCSGRLAIPGETDLATRYPDLAKEWHPTKNGDLTPDHVLPGSHHMAWWRCSQGHEWRAQIKARVNGTGCPVCGNKQVRAGDNDLQSRYPALAQEWHPTKNGALTPADVVPGTRRKVWWRCSKGHDYQASVASRVNGSGCPICAGKKVLAGFNDLATLYPDIAAQWHPSKNGALTPAQVTPASNKKVWWRCEKGHDYQAVISSRTMRGGGCPYCANKKVLVGYNDLATLYPAVAKEWHPTLNGPLTPQDVTPGSRRRVWWQCSAGHTWQAVIYSRTGTQHCSCPVCSGHASGKRRARYEQLEASTIEEQMHNGTLTVPRMPDEAIKQKQRE